MAEYSDLDPRFPQASPSDRKVMWFTVGNAPCRKYIISFYHIGVFGVPPGSCPAPANTFQIVLHESTGIVEYFFEQKSCLSTTNNGRAIFGIQNWTRDKAAWIPGRNPGNWNENQTGYRFIPSAGASRYVVSELYTLGGTLLATADTATTVTGLLDLHFLNICHPPGNNTYVVKTTFSACENPASQLTSYDTVYVNRTNSLNATATSTPTACGPPSGSITVTVPAGAGLPPYTFILDGTLTQTGNSPMVFNNVSGGPHSIVVTDVSGGCTSTINITVGQTTIITANATPTATSCPSVNDGKITVIPASGTAPFTFTLNPGAVVQVGATALFSGLSPGTYTINVTDVAGCAIASPLSVTITAGPALVATATSTATSCSGANNGTITVTPTNGNAPYTYTLDGGLPQTGGSPYTFTNVPAGPHNVVVADGAGCATNSIPVTITAGATLITTAIKTDVLCNGGNTGTITVAQPTIGTAPYQYSLDGVNWQTSNIFSGLVAGTYTVYYKEADGCQNSLSITIDEPAAVTSTAAVVAAVCNGQSNGTITISVSGGVPAYQYSIDAGANWQGSNVFNVGAGSYTILIKDANNCISQKNVTVTEPAQLRANSINTDASCNGGNDGVITVSASGGNSSYQYSLDGVNFQSSNIFNVAPGNYTVTVKDNLGCTTSFNTIVGMTSNLSVTPLTDPTICEGHSTQLQLNSNATVYAWSPAAGLSDATIKNPVANPTVTTQYIVTATLGRCSANDTVIVNVNAAPIPDAGSDGFICYGQTYQLQGSGGTSFSWAPSSYLDNPVSPNPIATPPKTTTYVLSIVSDLNGCNSLVTDSMFVDVTPPIKVKTFPYDTIGYPGDVFQIRALSPIPNPNYIYSWSPAYGLNNPAIDTPRVTVGAIGSDVVYQVTISTPAGCKGEGYVRLRVFKGPDIYVATGFTPNGDGKNDKFTPFPVGIKQMNYFRVFNRWGQLVFSSTTLHDGWDGTLGGKEQGAGVYVWMAEAITNDNKVITKKGTVVLIR
jgi:gliding motility-associated-like protein